MTKDEIKEKHLDVLHNIHLASGPYEVDLWLEKGTENLASGSALMSEKEYADSLQTLRVAAGSTKRKLAVHGY